MNNSDSPLMANNDEMSIGSSPSTVIELINYEDELDNMIPFEHDLYLTNEAEIEIDIAETTRDVLESLVERTVQEILNEKESHSEMLFQNEEIDCNNEYLNHFSLNPNLNEAVETEEGYDQDIHLSTGQDLNASSHSDYQQIHIDNEPQEEFLNFDLDEQPIEISIQNQADQPSDETEDQISSSIIEATRDVLENLIETAVRESSSETSDAQSENEANFRNNEPVFEEQIPIQHTPEHDTNEEEMIVETNTDNNLPGSPAINDHQGQDQPFQDSNHSYQTDHAQVQTENEPVQLLNIDQDEQPIEIGIQDNDHNESLTLLDMDENDLPYSPHILTPNKYDSYEDTKLTIITTVRKIVQLNYREYSTRDKSHPKRKNLLSKTQTHHIISQHKFKTKLNDNKDFHNSVYPANIYINKSQQTDDKLLSSFPNSQAVPSQVTSSKSDDSLQFSVAKLNTNKLDKSSSSKSSLTSDLPSTISSQTSLSTDVIDLDTSDSRFTKKPSRKSVSNTRTTRRDQSIERQASTSTQITNQQKNKILNKYQSHSYHQQKQAEKAQKHQQQLSTSYDLSGLKFKLSPATVSSSNISSKESEQSSILDTANTSNSVPNKSSISIRKINDGLPAEANTNETPVIEEPPTGQDNDPIIIETVSGDQLYSFNNFMNDFGSIIHNPGTDTDVNTDTPSIVNVALNTSGDSNELLVIEGHQLNNYVENEIVIGEDGLDEMPQILARLASDEVLESPSKQSRRDKPVLASCKVVRVTCEKLSPDEFKYYYNRYVNYDNTPRKSPSKQSNPHSSNGKSSSSKKRKLISSTTEEMSKRTKKTFDYDDESDFVFEVNDVVFIKWTDSSYYPAVITHVDDHTNILTCKYLTDDSNATRSVVKCASQEAIHIKYLNPNDLVLVYSDKTLRYEPCRYQNHTDEKFEVKTSENQIIMITFDNLAVSRDQARIVLNRHKQRRFRAISRKLKQTDTEEIFNEKRNLRNRNLSAETPKIAEKKSLSKPKTNLYKEKMLRRASVSASSFLTNLFNSSDSNTASAYSPNSNSNNNNSNGSINKDKEDVNSIKWTRTERFSITSVRSDFDDQSENSEFALTTCRAADLTHLKPFDLNNKNNSSLTKKD